MRRRGIAFQLSLLILSGSAVVLALIVLYNFAAARRIIVHQAEENAQHLVSTIVGRVETVLRATEKIPEALAQVASDPNASEDQIVEALSKAVERNREVYGIAIAFEPYTQRPEDEFFAPYYFKSDAGLRFKFLGSAAYRYFSMDWYQIPRFTGLPLWTEPYFDEGGGQVVMSTYAVPFYRNVGGEQRFAGVIAANVSLDWLKTVTGSVGLLDTGYAFLISHNGMIVTHPDSRLVMNESIFSLAESRDDPGLRALGRSMVGGESGSAQTQCLDSSGVCWLVYAAMPSNGWAVAALLPESEVLADVVSLSRTTLVLGGAGSLLLVIIVVTAARRLSRPLVALADASEHIARGDFDVAVPELSSQHEVGRLAAAFSRMQRELKRYIADLKSESLARERAATEAAALSREREAMQRELDIAADIQRSILPRTFPPFPERREIDLFAAMIPAREVGGDFYDFFAIDESRVGLVIGDVSGKGMPAAIFMAMSRTLLRATALHGVAPGECLERVNLLLTAENASEMFVTIVYAVLDTRTGMLTYANGGHPAPLLLRRGGEVEALPSTHGLALGVDAGARYAAGEIELAAGDAMLLFTDGVTEAFAAEGRLFSESRLRRVLHDGVSASAFDLSERVVSAVRAFAGEQPQSDDITVLALRYRPENAVVLRSFSLRNDNEELARARDAIDELANDAGLSPKVTFALQLALEEALTNVISYAFGDADEHSIDVRLALCGCELVAEIEDDGRPFNPLERATPNVEASVEERQIGGLGIHLVRTLMDDVAYERRGARNVLRMRKSTDAVLQD